MVPVPGMTCLGLEYFCFEGDGLWDEPGRGPDRAAPRRELEALGLARALGRDRTAPSSGCPRRIRSTTPRTATTSTAFARFIDPIPNLHTVGRNGMHKYNNQDHSMLTAMMAVRNMQGAAHDIWEVNTDFEYHEEQKLESRKRSERSRQAGDRMRIGVDATCWANGRGYGRFTRQLLPAMAQQAPDDEFVCFLDSAAFERFDLSGPERAPGPGGAGDGADRWPPRPTAIVRPATCCASPGRSGARIPTCSSRPSVYTYFPLPPGLRAVVTVHDAIAERFPRAHAADAARATVLEAQGGARSASGPPGPHGLGFRGPGDRRGASRRAGTDPRGR